MYKEKDLYHLADDYKNIKAPQDLKLKAAGIIGKNKKVRMFPGKAASLTAACLIAVVVAGANISPAFADSLKAIPIIGSAIELVTFRQYHEKTEHQQVDIDSARLQGMENAELQSSLNEKYASQAEALYTDFKDQFYDSEGNFTLISGYSVKADNGVTMSIEHSIFTAQASGAQSYTYDTIDTQKQQYITLPGLFKDDSYIELISQEIKHQIKEQTEQNQGATYYTDESAFDQIDQDQQFYINNDHKLTISFDEYAIAPGVMGAIEFVIPTEAIQSALVSNTYIN